MCDRTDMKPHTLSHFKIVAMSTAPELKKMTQTARKLGRGDGVLLLLTRTFYLLIMETEVQY